jgi:type III secretory pathway component EscT|tara:strand:- start:93 stop:485 length:393 start_codon:yes stop_codon:yes gene_type:complete
MNVKRRSLPCPPLLKGYGMAFPMTSLNKPTLILLALLLGPLCFGIVRRNSDQLNALIPIISLKLDDSILLSLCRWTMIADKHQHQNLRVRILLSHVHFAVESRQVERRQTTTQIQTLWRLRREASRKSRQ